MSRRFKQTPDVFLMSSGSKSTRSHACETVRYSCYLTKVLVEAIRTYAKAHGVSASAVIATAAHQFLDRQQEV